MFASLPILLSLLANPAMAEDSSCAGLTGTPLYICEVNALKARVVELQTTCSTACSSSSASSSKKVSTPRLDAAEKAIKALQDKLDSGDTTGVEDAINTLNDELDALTQRVDDHERRIAALEAAKDSAAPGIATPAPPVTRIVTINGDKGDKGADGRDGRPAEITLLGGASIRSAPSWSLVGGNLEFRVGGRPTKNLVLGAYGTGMMFGPDDFGVDFGGYAMYDFMLWIAGGVRGGVGQNGLDRTPEGARQVFEGPMGGVMIQVRPVGHLVIDANLGAFFTGADGTAIAANVAMGLRF